MSTRRPILLLEVNEVHWRIVDRALERHALPSLRAFVKRAATRTTHVVDGELSPWITWPSLHRGLRASEHGIHVLGQDVSTFRGRTLWEELRSEGESIGICGSLQSWPAADPGPGGFYVPDTFARDARCVPAFVTPLQQLNLRLAQGSGRVRSRHVPYRDALRALPSAIRARLSPRLALRIAKQLLLERRDPARAELRTTFQALFFWEVLEALFDPAHPPALSTFFTNHVASALHRHWDALFPDDFPSRRVAPAAARAMTFALEGLDQVIGRALALQRACPELVLVLASSMGQDAVHRTDHHGREVAIRDVAALLERIGIGRDRHRPSRAMVPAASTDVPDASDRAQLLRQLGGCRTAGGRRFLRGVVHGQSVSIVVGTPPASDLDRPWHAPDGTTEAWTNAGLVVHEAPPGTGTHVPEGLLAIVGEGVDPTTTREAMPLTDVKALLRRLGERDAH